jgi:hypothetical protein
MFRTLPLLAAIAALASAQQFRGNSTRVEGDRMISIFGPPQAAPVVTGAPYSGEQLQEYTEPGNTRVERSNVIAYFARDSKKDAREARGL